MPPVAAAVAAFAAWAGISAAAAWAVAAVTVLSAGMAVYGTAQARRAERQARDDAKANMKDRMATRIATESPHRYIYGRAKVGADVVAMFTSGDRDQFKHLVCVHAAHECDAIEEVWVANALVASLDASGDPTGGRFAVVPSSEIHEEQKTGPTFNLAFMPRAGSVWAFTGTGANMQPVPVTAVNGRTVTVATTGPVTVTYEMPLRSKMGDAINHADTPAATNPVVRVQRHLGGAGDVADVYLRTVVGEQWPATAVLRGLCYTVITLDLTHPEFQGGIPPIHVVLRGKKLYDPRTGVTAWSQNPALAIRDYLTSPLCGVPAADLPDSQFISAANVCDEASPTGGARYTMNGTVTSDQSQSSVLESMTQAMAGGLVATTWDVYAGKYIAPVMALLQEDIVGGLSITPGVSDASIYNGVKGQYVGPENKYVQTDFAPYQNSTYRANDGRDLYTNIDFPFTESLQRITNLARIFTEDQRNGFSIRAEFSLKAWPLKVGQRITFTSPFLGQSAKVYRITDKSYSPNSAVQLTLKEDAASIWDYADTTLLDDTPNSDLPDPWRVDPLASISCTSGESTLLRQADGSTVPRILASWPATAQANGIQIEVEWRAVSSPTWERTTVSAGETQAYLSPITPGFFYIVRARVSNPSLNIASTAVATVYQVEILKATPTVHMWAADKPAPPTGAASFLWSSGTFGAAPAGWSLTIPAAPTGGNVSLWAASVLVSDIDADGSAPFDWSNAGVASIGYAPAASGTGPAGYSNARVFAYQRKASAPAGTPGAVNYDFTTGTITTETLANGWQKTIPASDGNPLYVTSASASSAGTTDSIASGEWSGAVVLAYDGGAGTPGMNSASVTLYQRNNTGTVPALPNAAATYTFSPPGITGLTNGWTAAMPAATAGKYLFATTATAASTSATDAIAASEWAPAQILAQDGGNGVDGIKTAVVYAYQRSAGAPAGTPGAVTYDFTANAITTATLANGWQKTIPANNGNPLYVTAATASGTGATDSITGTEWSGAVVLAQDGGNGAAGLNNATVNLYQRTTSSAAPALPSASLTYTFATGALTAPNNGWLTYIPSTGGQYLHRTQATAIAATATDAIAPSEWAAVQLMYDAADLIAAKAAADAANLAIAAISSNNVLSKGEKPRVNTDFAIIVSERPGLIGHANGLGVDSSNYQSKFNALNSYLTSLGTGFTDFGTDYNIDGPVFSSRFADYYTAKQALLNDIVAKSATAPLLQLGGRNLYKRSSAINDHGGGSQLIARLDTGFQLRGIAANNGAMRMDGVIPANGTYTISFNLNVNVAAGFPLTLDFADGEQWTIIPTLTMLPYSRTFTVSNWTNVYSFIDFNGLSAQDYFFSSFKVEIGNKASAWTPAVEDVEAYAVAQATLARVTAEAYADGIVSEAEQRAIDAAYDDATIKANAAGKTAEWPSITGTGKPADNATVGAPVGTQVAGMDAAAVAAGAAAGNQLSTPFSVSINGGISEAGSGKYLALPSRTASVTGSGNLKSLQWLVGNVDESRVSILSGAATDTVSLASRVLITPATNNAFLTVTAIGLDGRIATDTVEVQAQHY